MTGGIMRPGGFSLTDRAIASCSFPAKGRVLDAGCGTGIVVEHLRSHHGLLACGIDIATCASRPFAQASVYSLPVKTGALNGVLCECVLSLLPDAGRALREFGRVLAVDGYLILSDLYDREQQGCMRELLQCCGFSIILWEDHTKALRELGALMALQGLDHTTCLETKKSTGYYLAVARKDTC